jgi:DNA repair protein RadA/Sms
MARSNVVKIPLRPCSRCGHKFPEAKSMCPRCKAINLPKQTVDDTIMLSDVEDAAFRRIPTGINLLDDALGGGWVTTSVVLIGGNPGAGKSTLSIQIADNLGGFSRRGKLGPTSDREVLYIATEEIGAQLKDRAKRLQLKNLDRIRVVPMGSRADLGDVIMKYKPCAVFVDSIANLQPDPELAVETTKNFKGYAEALDAPVLLVDHVTKADDFSGFMDKQHEPDTLLTLYAPDASSEVRELTPLKNRFGPANVQYYMMMTEHGLVEIEEDEEEGE